MSFSLKQKALHFSTADLNTLNKGLHPAHMAERETGKQNEPEPELNPNWLLAGLGLPAACFTPPPPSSPPCLPADPGGLCWVWQGLVGRGRFPFPGDRYLMPWSSPDTIFPGTRLRRDAGPSAAGAQVSGGSRSHTLRLGKTGGEERRSDPLQDAPCLRGLHLMCQRRWQVGHCSCCLCQQHGKACRWVSSQAGARARLGER